MNPRPILRFLGRLLLLLAGAQLLPSLVSLIYSESRSTSAFLVTAAVTSLAGLLLMTLGRGEGEPYRREGALIVIGAWSLASLSGALPYVLVGMLGPVDAIFESASGFTTTGATILTDIEGAGFGLLFWRSFSQWLGGIGIVVLLVSLLPELGPGARYVYKLEVPGPHAEILHPRVAHAAATLLRLYVGLTALLVVLLLASGLSLYDATVTAFSTLSTGGHSPHSESIAYFDSALVEVIIICFILIAGTNFSLFYGLRTHRGRLIWRDSEFRVFLLIIAGVSAVVTWSLVSDGATGPLWRTALDATFQVASLMTGTGFATADFDQWPNLARGLLLVVMFVGGCAGSTTGGPKVIRMMIGIKAALREARLTFSPRAVVAVFIGKRSVPESVVHAVTGFFVLYISVWGLGTVLLTIGGHSLQTAASAAVATLGNVGPGLEGVGPTSDYSFFAGWQKLLMVLLMLMGRLELYAIVSLSMIAFWRR